MVSIQSAPRSVYIDPCATVIEIEPERFTTGAMKSCSITVTVRVADPVLPAASTLR